MALFGSFTKEDTESLSLWVAEMKGDLSIHTKEKSIQYNFDFECNAPIHRQSNPRYLWEASNYNQDNRIYFSPTHDFSITHN